MSLFFYHELVLCAENHCIVADLSVVCGLAGDDLMSLLFHFLDEFLFLFSAEPFFIARVCTAEKHTHYFTVFDIYSLRLTFVLFSHVSAPYNDSNDDNDDEFCYCSILHLDVKLLLLSTAVILCPTGMIL